MKENLEVIPEDLEIFSVGEKDYVIPGDGGGCLNNYGSHGQISVPKAISDQDGTLMSSEITICQEFSLSLSLDAKVQKCFNKCPTFPVSREMHVYSLSTDGRADSSIMATQGQKVVASGTSAYSRSISLPVLSISLPSSSTLVSALKGGRALNGTTAKLDLRVKWAPEVYEPPVTSMSHTVKAHPQRHKSKKKDKRKYKGKSSRGNGKERKHDNTISRGNGNERKHGNQRWSNTISKPSNVRVQANDDMLPRDQCGKSKMDAVEYNFKGQEAKCGSSFLREGRPKVHLPIGEAS